MANPLNDAEAFCVELFTTPAGAAILKGIPQRVINALAAGGKRDLLEADSAQNWGLAKKGMNFAKRVGRAPAAVAAGVSEMAIRQAIFDEVDGSRARFDGSSIIKRLQIDPKSPAGEPVRQMLRGWGKDGVLTVEGSGFHTKYRVSNPNLFFAAPADEVSTGEAADEVSAVEVVAEGGDVESGVAGGGDVESTEVVAEESEVTADVSTFDVVSEAAETIEVTAEVEEATPAVFPAGKSGRRGSRR